MFKKKRPSLWRGELLRYSSGQADTLGLLFDATDARRFLGYTLEDEARVEKLRGETRIPSGTYQIGLRTEGGTHAKYAARFGELHRGMLWIMDVPGFEFILMHLGNTDVDTDGCILFGDQVLQNVTGKGALVASEKAYRRIYPTIADAAASGGASITILDYA